MKEKEKAEKSRSGKVTFKAYEQNQMWLLPPSLGELIPEGHIVRLINHAIDSMDLEPILNSYQGGGASNFHPRMMLKALVYGYVDRLYSSRRIEKALKENICYMWLCGMQQPDHNTLNRFRKGQLKDTVKQVFAQILTLLIEEGYVRMEDYHIDGTKIESVANRYTPVWAKTVARNKAKLVEKIEGLVEQIEQVNEQAEKEQVCVERERIENSEALSRTIQRINEQLQEELGNDKKRKKKVKELQEEHLPKLQHYENQEAILGGRGSYSKTDPDATFMRMKEDHLNQGQLKPAYNVQIGTEDQFIVNFSVHQNPTDTTLLKPHLEDTQAVLGSIQQAMPKRCIADAGYGSEENYDYLEGLQIEAYVKYQVFFQEQQPKYQADPFQTSNWFYNEEQDFYVCPMGQHLTYRNSKKVQSTTGYESDVKVYVAQNCNTCPLQGLCLKAKQTNRVLERRPNLERHRDKARKNLKSIRGIHLRKQRNIDVESVFGHIKGNRLFRRFLLRSLEKVNIEVGLLAIAHNLKKWWANIQQGIGMPTRPGRPPKNPQTAQIAWENLLFCLFCTLRCHSLPQMQKRSCILKDPSF